MYNKYSRLTEIHHRKQLTSGDVPRPFLERICHQRNPVCQWGLEVPPWFSQLTRSPPRTNRENAGDQPGGEEGRVAGVAPFSLTIFVDISLALL
jgi:hypothetical protein